MFTHRHADGGFYKLEGPQKGKHPETGAWIDGVCYRGIDNEIRWTDAVRWADRFEELPPSRFHDVEVVEIKEEGHVVAAYVLQVEEIGDARVMLISASNVCKKQNDHHVEMVLRCQADMIAKGLHIRDVEFPDLLGDVNAFHVKFSHGLEHYGIPRMLPQDLFEFRDKFHTEETTEYRDEQPTLVDAMQRGDHREIVNSLELQLDALCDAVWVLLGTADIQFGRAIFYAAWARVVKANMAKVRADKADADAIDSGRNKKFDIVKPAGWTPPDHRDLVQNYLKHDPEPVEFMGTAQEV
jgi:hypothetical protein